MDSVGISAMGGESFARANVLAFVFASLPFGAPGGGIAALLYS